jgi:hypothetical protein
MMGPQNAGIPPRLGNNPDYFADLKIGIFNTWNWDSGD